MHRRPDGIRNQKRRRRKSLQVIFDLREYFRKVHTPIFFLTFPNHDEVQRQSAQERKLDRKKTNQSRTLVIGGSAPEVLSSDFWRIKYHKFKRLSIPAILLLSRLNIQMIVQDDRWPFPMSDALPVHCRESIVPANQPRLGVHLRAALHEYLKVLFCG